MASKSLYRKYRPQTFSDVVGQEHIEQTLRNALSNDRVAHAYLFCGPRGTGKTTTARLLAKALLCDQAPTANPCGVCQNCVDIAESTHPDVYEIDAASRTGVDNVREEIIGRVAFSPTRGRYKIYIIDEVHMLSTGAFNALLKTLEEPPDHIVFVMCTTESHKVPQTIVSRCQRFDFHSLTTSQIKQCLEHICDGEGFTFDDDGIDLIAEQAKGGMRDAITALEQVSVFGNGHISFEAAQNMFGDVDTERLSRLIDFIARRDMCGCFEWVEEISRTGIDTAQTARDMTAYVRNIYLIAIAGRTDALPPMAPPMLEVLERQAAELGSPDRIASMMLTLGNLMGELRVSADARLSLEIAITRMAHVNTELTLESLSARIDALEFGRGAGGAAEFSVAGVASGVAAGLVTNDGVAGEVQFAAGEARGQAQEDGEASAVSAAAQDFAAADAAAAPAVLIADSAPVSTPTSSAVSASTPASTDVSSAASAETSVPTSAPVAAPSASSVQAASVSGASSQPQSPTPAQASASTQNLDASQQQTTAAASYLKDPGSLRRLWDAAVRSVGQEHAMIPGLMAGARPHANLRDMKITVELPSNADFALSTLSRADSMQWMRDALKKSFGTDVQLEYKLGGVPSQSTQQTGQSFGASNPAANQGFQAAQFGAANTSAPEQAQAMQQDDFGAPVEETVPLSAYEQALPAEDDATQVSEPAPETESASMAAFAMSTAQHQASVRPSTPPMPVANETSEELPTAPLPPQNKPASGDMELADILGDVFEDGVEYRAPN